MKISNKTYQIIYADPPWKYRVWGKKSHGRSAENHYPTMELEDIKSLDVSAISSKNCALFLWVTIPCLLMGLELVKAWGFQYKTIAFVWIKRNRKSPTYFFGLGHWTRSNAELCVLATRGHPKRQSKKVFQIVDTPIERHSKKPDIVRERIVELIGDVPRIELFAREKICGWDCWGNEV